MTYGFEVVIPLESGFLTLRTSLFTSDSNDQLLQKSLDLVMNEGKQPWFNQRILSKSLNKVIVNGLKKRLDEVKGRWVKELSHVLWTYRTTLRRLMEETPFSMTYGFEAVIPLELGFPTLRTSLFTPDSNDQLLQKSLDLVMNEGKQPWFNWCIISKSLNKGMIPV